VRDPVFAHVAMRSAVQPAYAGLDHVGPYRGGEEELGVRSPS
jgi:hypothetical protein